MTTASVVAAGAIAAPPDDGFDALIEKIARVGGVPCADYKASCLRRRVGVRMRATGTMTCARYSAFLDTVPAEWPALMNALTINVTGFFRDALVFESLARNVIAPMAHRAHAPLTAWSAGCASGEEAWTMAMLLAESVGSARTRVIATDIDIASLDRASGGSYPGDLAREIPATLRERWWNGSDPVCAATALRACVHFVQHNMLTELPPATNLDVITCRNVIIYFSRAAQEALFTKFADALRIGGVLVLGKVEMLAGPARARFAAVDVRERIYRRIA